MTTLQPRKPYTEEELRRLYPEGLDLQLVQILLRHGERTPISARFQNAGLPAFWPYCSVVRKLRSTVLEGNQPLSSTFEWSRRLETFGPDDEPLIASGPSGELDGICDMGSLTDVGRASTYQLGRRLRELYVDRLRFLPPTIRSANMIYLRSTPIPRTVESLQQTFWGLYPASTRLASPVDEPSGQGYRPFQPPTIITRAPGDETLYPNDGNCRRFAALSRAFAQRTADRWNGSEDMAYLNKLWSRWMPKDSSRVAVDSRPRLSGIMDTVNASLAHGHATRLPSEFYDPKAMEIIDKIAVEEWFSGYRESREYRALGIGSLMGDIVGRMVGSTEGSTADGQYELPLKGKKQSSVLSSQSPSEPIKLGLSGCHDTTLAGVLASMGAFDDGKWPPFTSHIAIELFRRSSSLPSPQGAATTATGNANGTESNTTITSSWWSTLWSKIYPVGRAAGSPPPGIGRKPIEELTGSERKKLDGYYVRMRYNDEPVTIPGCRAPGNHLEGNETFCTLEAFKSIVDKFTPRNWKAECRMNTGAPNFPETPEPAGQ